MTWKANATGTRIIVDADALSPENLDVQSIARDKELSQIKACLAPMAAGRRPGNIWLSGPTGSGKTVLAQVILRQVIGTTHARVGVSVDCWRHHSLHGVLQALIEELQILGAEATDTNVKFERVRQALRGRPAVIVLENIDRAPPLARDEIIYGLLGMPKTGLLCMSNSTRALAMLDERARSRLSPAMVELRPYATTELVEVLANRARRGLIPGSWSPAVLNQIAAAADGDARVAIEMLRHAADRAEHSGQNKLQVHSIATQLRKLRSAQEEARLMGLSQHERIIREQALSYAPVGTTRLRELYVVHCRKEGLEPVARRTFSKYLARLGAAGVLRVPLRTAGTGGRIVRTVQNQDG